MATMSTGPAKSPQEIFVSLVREHERLLHKVCHLYCHREDERGDLLQEILLQLWRSLPTYQARSKPATWIYRVALNTAITFLRKSGRSVYVGALLEETGPGCEGSEFRQVEDAEMLERAMATLSDAEKAVLLLHLEEKSYTEIGEILGISEKAVSVKLVRITNRLRLWYQDVSGKGGIHGTR